MKYMQGIFKVLLALMVIGLVQSAGAQEEEAAAPAAPAAPEAAKAAEANGGDDDWLNTVWTQVDAAIERETEAQNITTVAGVRGAEAEDSILDKLYYKGAKRYPSQNKLQEAIKTLKKSIEKDPKAKDVAKFKFYIGQCYEKLGQMPEAKDFYNQIVKQHSKDPEAAKAQKRLAALNVKK